MPRHPPKRRAEINNVPDRDAMNELDLYAENTGELYEAKKKILAKMAHGYGCSPSVCLSLWRYWLDTAAIRYQREIGPRHFSNASKDALAREFLDHYAKNLKDYI